MYNASELVATQGRFEPGTKPGTYVQAPPGGVSSFQIGGNYEGANNSTSHSSNRNNNNNNNNNNQQQQQQQQQQQYQQGHQQLQNYQAQNQNQYQQQQQQQQQQSGQTDHNRAQSYKNRNQNSDIFNTAPSGEDANARSGVAGARRRSQQESQQDFHAVSQNHQQGNNSKSMQYKEDQRIREQEQGYKVGGQGVSYGGVSAVGGSTAGNLNRPTSRVLAPPGGKSQITFG